MLSQRKILFAAATVALTLGVTACGSSNDDNTPPPVVGAPVPAPPPSSEIPPGAGASVAAFIAFLLTLAASDTAEPLALGTFTPPVDDVTEPQAL
jgi:hypothetical protein